MKSNSIKKISIGVAVIVSIAVIASFGLGFFALFWGMTPSELESKDGNLKISGIYGETIPFSEIKSVELINTKPQILRRTNGYSLGSKMKGYFANSQEKFKLFIDQPELPWILITKQNDRKVYYSSSRKNNAEIFEDLIKTLPNNVYNTSIP